MTSSSSLPTLKSQFLTSQIRLLSSPLTPSTTFTETYLSHSTSNSNGKKQTNHNSTLNDTSALDSTINETTNPLDDQNEHEDEVDSTLQSLPNNPNSNKHSQPEAALTSSQLAQILDKVNAKIAAHNKRVFPSISQRHVIEQIEGLYLDTALDGIDVDDRTRDIDVDEEEGDFGEERSERGKEQGQQRRDRGILTAVTRDTDLTSTSTITALPESLQSTLLHPKTTTPGSIPSTQQNTYKSLHTTLQTLSETRDTLLKTQATFLKLQTLLSPFSDPKTNVQGNLVGIREEEGLQREMERLRVLVARVVGSLNREGGFRGDQRRRDEGTVGHEKGEGAQGRTVDERLKMILEMGADTT